MNEIKRSEIIYEEGWRESAPSVTIEEPSENPTEPAAEATGKSVPLLSILRLAVCLLLALALFLLRSMGSEAYDAFMDFWHEELEKPVVPQGAFSSLDVSRLFPSEQATADEAEIR